MNVLLTGALGFTGRNLCCLLAKDQSLILHTSDIFSDGGFDNYTCCELIHPQSARELVQKTKPEMIFHLTGTFANEYEKDYAGNVLTTRNILEAVKNLNQPCRTLLIGSAAEYGIIDQSENPVKETQALRPASIYGLTKVYQTLLMQYYVRSGGLDIVMARLFNIFGKGISTKLFVGRLYQQIQLFKNGKIDRIQIGNLDNERDYISIEETITHYVTIMHRGMTGEVYNVARGIPLKTRTLLENIIAEEGIDLCSIESVPSKRDQTYDVPQIYADIRKLNQLSGGKIK